MPNPTPLRKVLLNMTAFLSFVNGRPTVVGSCMSKTVVRVGENKTPAPDVGQVASKERSESIYSVPNPLTNLVNT